jgi:hypothetical protein
MPAEQIKIRSSYNLAAMSFTPTEIAAEIKKHIPELRLATNQTSVKKNSHSWPASIDDHQAGWNWNHKYDLKTMTIDMLEHLK